MKILLLGKDGQLGRAFEKIFAIHRLTANYSVESIGRAQCDIANDRALTAYLQRSKPTIIINAAAYTAVDQAEQNVDLAYAINAKAPEILARYAIEKGATLLHYSTDYVFDGTKGAPYEELDVRNPLGVYGKSKAAGEAAIEEVFKANPKAFAQFAILRTSWVYGDGENFIRTILRLAKERESLDVVANQHGVPTHANWLARMSLALLLGDHQHVRAFPSGTYHVVPPGETTWHALAVNAVQVASDAGAVLKLRPEQIKPICASEYPQAAPRPLNSRLARSTFGTLMQKQMQGASDMPKWQQLWQAPWHDGVKAYVHDLVAKQLL